jgi:hypothetical protein
LNTETFISYRNFKWLWITAATLLVATVVYLLDQPAGGRNGGTVVGYALGVISTLAIVWLMFYGARKRAYSSNLGTLQGWLAAHVWIGLGLIVLVPLHAGFSFGMNVHTLTYVLMVVTIVSGIWGAANYRVLAQAITAHRGGESDRELIEEIARLEREVDAARVGKSERFLALSKRFDFTLAPGLLALFRSDVVPVVDPGEAGALVGEIDEGERSDALRLLGMLDRRADLARALLEQARIRALLRVWLFIHVPASVGLCVTLAIHIFSVFFFW